MDGPRKCHTERSKSEREGEISNFSNEVTKPKETGLENKLRVTGVRDSYEVWGGHVHTAIFKMDNQQGPII